MKPCPSCQGVFYIGTGNGDEVFPHCPKCHRSPAGGIDLQAAIADLQSSVAGVHLDLGMPVPDAIVCPTRATVERLRPSPAVKRSTQRSVEAAYRSAGSRRFGKGGGA